MRIGHALFGPPSKSHEFHPMNKLAENIYGAKFDKHTKYTEHL